MLFTLMPEVQAQLRRLPVFRGPRVNVPSVKVWNAGRIPYVTIPPVTIPPKTNLNSHITPGSSFSSRLKENLRSQWPNFWLATTPLTDACRLDSTLHHVLALSESTRLMRGEEARLTHVSSRLTACKIYEEMNDSLSAYLMVKEILKDSLTEQERPIVGSKYPLLRPRPADEGPQRR